ncbi:MAG: hypothetical protein PHN75_08000 [Syntrophales bacterium]|nr:hypothetical protein [Syntrophales bacterium]
MKKLLLLATLLVFALQTGVAQADKAQVTFAIQKAKSTIEKVKAKSIEVKASPAELTRALDYVDHAEVRLKQNTNMLGLLKKDAEPGILRYTEMAEISAATALSRLEKINQENENAKLEAMIPSIEAKIKVFNDMKAEIGRLKDELNKPRSDVKSLGGEVSQLKKEKLELAEQASKMKLEKENLSGKLEVLNGVIASTKKDLTEKSKAAEDLTTENQHLKENLKSLEARKGSDIVEMNSKLQTANRKIEYYDALGRLGYLAKLTDRGWVFIVPRSDLLRTAGKGPVLAADAKRHIARFQELMKKCPECKMKIDVHGFGNPPKSEDRKATESMANLLKKAMIEGGIKESSIQTGGFGSALPLYQKGTPEINRRAEITIYQ